MTDHPKPGERVEYQIGALLDDHDVPGDRVKLFTELCAEMRAQYERGRVAGLEEAAKACEEVRTGTGALNARIGVAACILRIRAILSPTTSDAAYECAGQWCSDPGCPAHGVQPATCARCGGTGVLDARVRGAVAASVVCPDCKPGTPQRCIKCNGLGALPSSQGGQICYSCAGTGKPVTCARCGGTGNIWNKPAHSPCPVCRPVTP